MTTKRDNRILLMLMIQAAISAANASAYLSTLFPPKGVAAVGLLSVMISAVTGVYVTLTRETERLPPRGITPGDRQA